MIFSEEIICQICKKKYSKLGIASHVLYSHNIDPEIYRKQYIYRYKKCHNCGKDIIYPRKFCSPRCVNVYRANKVKCRNPLITHKKIIEDEFNKLTEYNREIIVKFYKKNIVTHSDLSKKFDISIDVIKKILKNYKIKSYDCRVFLKKEEKKERRIL